MREFKVSRWTWFHLLSGLKKRGKGVRESGAFLLAKRGKSRVSKVVFYDELDKHVSDSGIIKFNGSGYVKFWPMLKDWGMEVIADIHTHPGENTDQSHADMTHPMIRIKGHLAVIAPNYAKNRWIKPNDCSSYLYLGSFKWKKLLSSSPLKLIWL
ncbi:hypothetical protein QQ020_26090 [Fulvivirgaceae bacterium BMA12]|uniref:JAB domain-containing protein n=1 Tax=Agaribacillus aureus TaxID=3051825 RepID=A0ABT8LCS3_9BACT|nr:hypothetical protein [Fulvivirgaceae bacterium BMA12]